MRNIHFYGSSLVCTLCLISLACGAGSDAVQEQSQDTAAFVLERTVSIPVQVVTAETPAGVFEEFPERLAITTGAEDELPQGPQGFEVLPDGSFVVADPLRRRLVFYDNAGTFYAQWPIGLPAGSISFLDDGALEVRNVFTGAYFIVDELGQASPVASEARNARMASEYGQVALDRDTRNRGQITLSGARGEGGGTLEVTLDSDTTQMISLQSLGRTSGDNYIYVALETTRGGAEIDVEKIVRVYDADGGLLGQLSNIPLDYFIHPVNEFQIEGGKIYQLVPGQDAVLINVWALP